MKKDYVAVDAELADTDETKFVEQFWTDRWNAGAKANTDVTRTDEYRLMRPYLAELSTDARVLDGGCGLGEWTICLQREGFNVLGMDLSRQVVERLRTIWPEHHFAAGDIRATSLEARSLDAYFSWGTFEHFETGLAACIDEARRILKPCGQLFITVPFHNWRHILRESRQTPRARTATSSQFRFYQWRLTMPELRSELEMRGFRVKRVVPIAKTEGVYRLMRNDLGAIKEGTVPFAVTRRALKAVLPASWVGHMLFAAAERLPDA